MPIELRRLSEEFSQTHLGPRKDSLSPPDPLWEQARRLSEAGVRRGSDASVILTEDTSGFIIGDRVWVGGTTPGKIAFIGETQFATGEWAGIALDEPQGKNDGAVAGVRYFQCQPQHGTFARLTRLTRTPLHKPGSPLAHSNGSGEAKKASPTGSSADFRDRKSPSPSPSTTSRKGSTAADIKIGDRVFVSSTQGSTKKGVLRYLGHTQFASGVWAGVELDDPVGKNDGIVNGVHYFDCKARYGLFAPESRVSKAPTIRPSRTSSTGLRRQGSKESLSSVTSNISSVSRTTTPRRPSRPSTDANHSALSELLREKAEQVDQLLNERDLERAETAKAASRADSLEQELVVMRQHFEQFKEEVKMKTASFEESASKYAREIEELMTQLEEERRKNEDLQFRLEEEGIAKSELQEKLDEKEEKLKQLQATQEQERKRLDELEQLSCSNFEKDEILLRNKDEIERLKQEIESYTSRLSLLEEMKKVSENDLCASKNKLEEKREQVQELEFSLSERNKEIDTLKDQMQKLQQDYNLQARQKEQQREEFDKFSQNMVSKDEDIVKLRSELQTVQLELSDTQRKLQMSEEKYNKVSQQKSKLESDMSSVMNVSTDSNREIAKLRQDVQDREKEVNGVQEKLNIALQEKGQSEDRLLILSQELASLKESHETITKKLDNNLREYQQAQEQIQELTTVKTRNEDGLHSVEAKLASADADKEKLRQSLSDAKQQNECILDERNQLEGELNLLKKTLEVTQNTVVDLKMQCKLSLEQGSTDIATLQKKLDSSESQIKNLNEVISDMKSYHQKEMLQLQEEKSKDVLSLQQKIETERAKSGEITGSLSGIQESLANVNEECSRLKKENTELKTSIAMLQSDNDSVRKDFESSEMKASEQGAQLQASHHEIQSLRNSLLQAQQDVQHHLSQADKDVAAFKDLSEKLKNTQQESISLSEIVTQVKEENINLKQEIADWRSRCDDCQQKCADLSEELHLVRQNQHHMSSSISTEKDNLVKTVQMLTDNLSKRDDELETLRKEVRTLRLEKDKYPKLAAPFDNQEKWQLEQKVADLQVQLAHSQINANLGNSSHQSDEDERELMKGEIELLRGVLLDKQKKEDSLLEELERYKRQSSRSPTPGDSGRSSSKRKVAPRLYCDICEMFDLHDTEDCPTQASESPTHSMFNRPRGEPRPYCEVCQVFDHWTEDCDGSETF